MTIKQVITLSILCLLPLLFGLTVWDNLPEQLPIHFDYSGTPDNYASKAFVVFGLPFIIGALNLFVYFLRLKDPKKRQQPEIVQYVTHCIFPVLSTICVSLSIFHGLETNFPISTILFFVVGFMIAFIGNYMPKIKQNYVIGIKLPWTLNDENNWKHTHRLSGFIWTLGGIAMCINSFFNFYIISIIIAIIIIFLPLIISYLYYVKQKENKHD